MSDDGDCCYPITYYHPGVWKSFDQAPTDGTEVLIIYPLQGNTYQLGHFDIVHKHWMSKGVWIAPASQHCLWTPLPSPPHV